jgi:hypothetical protein
MVTFGLFNTSDTEPRQVYEGDYMRMDKPPFVIIYRYTSPDRGTSEQVANIHLDKGQSVKGVADGTQPGFINPRAR